jgi:RNA polymerase sigma factor (sigma-70 family)
MEPIDPLTLPTDDRDQTDRHPQWSPMNADRVRQAQAGDKEAFAAIAAGAISWMHRTARLILRDDDRANDAVQDALTNAWLDIRAIRDPERLDPWLRRMLVRACFRVSASEARHRSRVTRALSVNARPSLQDASADVVLRDQIDRAFRRLTPDQRAVLVMRHYLDLSDSQAAEALGIPPGTVKSRLSRAAAALRAAIDADERQLPAGNEVLA